MSISWFSELNLWKSWDESEKASSIHHMWFVKGFGSLSILVNRGASMSIPWFAIGFRSNLKSMRSISAIPKPANLTENLSAITSLSMLKGETSSVLYFSIICNRFDFWSSSLRVFLRTVGGSAKRISCGKKVSFCSFMKDLSMTYDEREKGEKSR